MPNRSEWPFDEIDILSMIGVAVYPPLFFIAVPLHYARRSAWFTGVILDQAEREGIELSAPLVKVTLPGAYKLGVVEDPEEEETPRNRRRALPVPEGGKVAVARSLVRRREEAAEERPDDEEDDMPSDLMSLLIEARHLLVIGHTGGGKTTLIHHLATTWASDGSDVFVFDPDAAPGLWDGCQVYGAGDNFDEMEKVGLPKVKSIIKQRREARARGQREFHPEVYVVVDEAGDVLKFVRGARDLFEDVVRRGRKLGVHFVLGVQDKQVKTLKLEGASELLQNLVRVSVKQAHRSRVAEVLYYGGVKRRYMVPILPNPEDLIIDPEHTPSKPTELPKVVAATCVSCGDELRPGGKFCINCGAAVSLALPGAVAAYDFDAAFSTMLAGAPKPQVRGGVLQFVARCCTVDPQKEAPAGVLYEAYKEWCEEGMQKPISATMFGMVLTQDLKFEKLRSAKGRNFYIGLELKGKTNGSSTGRGSATWADVERVLQ